MKVSHKFIRPSAPSPSIISPAEVHSFPSGVYMFEDDTSRRRVVVVNRLLVLFVSSGGFIEPFKPDAWRGEWLTATDEEFVLSVAKEN